MDPSVIAIALFQLNVALGILYLGLPHFRSRENYYNTVVEHINTQKYSETFKGEAKKFRDKLMGSDSKFSRYHHRVRKKIIGLPSVHYNQLNEREIFRQNQQTRDSSNKWHHRWCGWFGDNWDKCIVGLFAVLIPTVVLWAYYLWPPPKTSYPKFWEGPAIVCGQISVFVFFYFGQEKLKWSEKRLYNALLYMTEAIRMEQASSDTEDPPDEEDDPPYFASNDDLPF